jgi:hypothetical protein
MNSSHFNKSVARRSYSRVDSTDSLRNLPLLKQTVRLQDVIPKTKARADSVNHDSPTRMRRNICLKHYRVSYQRFDLRRKSIVQETQPTLRNTIEQIKARRTFHDCTTRSSNTRVRPFVDCSGIEDLDDQINFLKGNVIDRLVGIS